MAHQPSDTEHKYCSVCGEPATNIICQSCQAKIQGEAAHRKQQTEKGAKTDTRRK
jgi:predicted amidophosphoribosyltransferase